jgi:hypothetical protein
MFNFSSLSAVIEAIITAFIAAITSLCASLAALAPVAIEPAPIDRPADCCSYGEAGSEVPAVPAPSPVDEWVESVGPDYFENQEKLRAFRVWLEQQPDFESSGFVDKVNDAENGSMTLLWHGEDGLLARAVDEAAARGLGVTVVQRAMSQAESLAAASKVWELADYLKQRGFVLHGATGITWVTSGVLVLGEFDKSVEDVAGLSRELEAEISQAVGAPVQLNMEEW